MGFPDTAAAATTTGSTFPLSLLQRPTSTSSSICKYSVEDRNGEGVSSGITNEDVEEDEDKVELEEWDRMDAMERRPEFRFCFCSQGCGCDFPSKIRGSAAADTAEAAEGEEGETGESAVPNPNLLPPEVNPKGGGNCFFL
jgi:hypothetical protein